MVCKLQIIQGKITRHCELRVQGHAGNWFIRGGARVINHFFSDLEDISEVFSSIPLSDLVER